MKIKLTSHESDLWNWAKVGADAYWSDDDARDDGLHFDQNPVSIAENGFAEIANDLDVIDDMIYRLGNQTEDIYRNEGSINNNGHGDSQRMNAIRKIRIGKCIMKKIKNQML